jgi:hypothetical protein
MACIKKNYNISSDWNGTAYCGLTLDWDYENHTVDLSVPGYIKSALHKYQHPAPARPEHAPHTWNPPIYGAKTQFVNDTTLSPALSEKYVNKLKQLTTTLLYYARAVDPTLIMPINVLASEQSNAAEVTADKVIKLLNDCNTHPDTKIRYHASDMKLHIHSDASYLSESEAKSRAGGFFYMCNTTKNDKKLNNGAILIVSKVLKHGMSSAAEAEICAVFINAKEGAVLRTTLEELGHKQPPPHQWKRIIPLPQYTSMVQLNKNEQKPWICAFIGSRIELNKANLKLTGAQVFKIWRIISQNIIRRHITNQYEIYTFTPANDRQIGKEFGIPHCEGVLIPQVRLANKYPISPPWEMIQPPGGDSPVHI